MQLLGIQIDVVNNYSLRAVLCKTYHDKTVNFPSLRYLSRTRFFPSFSVFQFLTCSLICKTISVNKMKDESPNQNERAVSPLQLPLIRILEDRCCVLELPKRKKRYVKPRA